MPNIQYSLVRSEDDKFLVAQIDGEIKPLPGDHPNFDKVVAELDRALAGEDVDVDALLRLFDVTEAVAAQFKQLSERVSVRNGTVLLDGDPVHGSLQEQILQFLEGGEDFRPLVEFYEKLLTNPLGDVREGLYDWIAGQRKNGNFTITPKGTVLGYKSVQSRSPEWREDEEVVYVPSRRGEGIVNGREVKANEFIEQVEGDVVEMPRSRVLHRPSQECGDGLHIGTYEYASTFTGDTVMLVEFDPRDIVSLPDSASSWKLRVCRYTVVEPVTSPLDVPLYSPQGRDNDEPEQAPEETLAGGYKAGDRVEHLFTGSAGTVAGPNLQPVGGDIVVEWDDGSKVPTRANSLTPLVRDADGSPIHVGDRVSTDNFSDGTVLGFDDDDDPIIRWDDGHEECSEYADYVRVITDRPDVTFQ